MQSSAQLPMDACAWQCASSAPWPILLMERCLACFSLPSSPCAFSSKKQLQGQMALMHAASGRRDGNKLLTGLLGLTRMSIALEEAAKRHLSNENRQTPERWLQQCVDLSRLLSVKSSNDELLCLSAPHSIRVWGRMLT